MDTMEEKHGENRQKDACALEELGKLSNTVTSSKEETTHRPVGRHGRPTKFVCEVCHEIIAPGQLVSRPMWTGWHKGHHVATYKEPKHPRQKRYFHQKCFDEACRI